MTSPSATTVPLAGREVGRIGYGAMQLTHGGHVAAEDAKAILRLAAESGVSLIDTAWFYGAGACNALIRDALAPYPETLVIATKLGADSTPGGGLAPAQRPKELRQQVEANLTSLGTDRLDLVYLRRLDMQPGIIATGDQLVDLDDQLAELTALRDAGQIRALALSNVDATQLRQALPAGIEAVQNAYNLLDRATEPVLDVCRAHDIAWIPYFPLGSAFPGFHKVTDDPTVQAIARDLDATPSQVGLAWLLATYARTLLIPGTTSPAHLSENLATATLTLPAEPLSRLTAQTP